MKNIVYSLLILFAFASCDKDSHRRIKFRLVSKTSNHITYSINGNWFNENGVAGDWSKSYRVKKGSNFYLSAFKTGAFFDVTILVYFDGEIYASQTTDEMGDLIEIEGTVP